MQEVTKNIYIDDQFPGVTLGVIVTPRGLIQIDAPPSPEDARTWRASLMSLGGGIERVLVNMDAHPDRTLGARAMDCIVVAHEKLQIFFVLVPVHLKHKEKKPVLIGNQFLGLAVCVGHCPKFHSQT
ncbi:MAG: hypothetical protein HC797_04675 [Anaerolineales bacterium]|nr:hypothetical protein [Anaerolineales bacterium]